MLSVGRSVSHHNKEIKKYSAARTGRTKDLTHDTCRTGRLKFHGRRDRRVCQDRKDRSDIPTHEYRYNSEDGKVGRRPCKDRKDESHSIQAGKTTQGGGNQLTGVSFTVGSVRYDFFQSVFLRCLEQHLQQQQSGNQCCVAPEPHTHTHSRQSGPHSSYNRNESEVSGVGEFGGGEWK